MNTVLLQYALEVEKTGSITQAANNLYMEQPNLSKAIKSLEEMMGAPIFKRSSKGVIPTKKGKAFLEHAKNVLEELERMEGIYKKQEENGLEFRISIPRATYINEAFSRFVSKLGRDQGLSLWLKETNPVETVEAVAEGTCQLGILRYPVEHERYYTQLIREKELHEKLVWEFSPLLLMSDRHPLAGKETIVSRDLTGYTEILQGDIKQPDGADAAKRQAAMKRRIYVFERGSQLNLLQTNPDTYMWVSALPARCLDQHSLVQKTCVDAKERYRDVYVCRQGYEWNPYDHMFLEEVRTVRRELGGG